MPKVLPMWLKWDKEAIFRKFIKRFRELGYFQKKRTNENSFWETLFYFAEERKDKFPRVILPGFFFKQGISTRTNLGK